ncbi:MAG: hypothetical protein JWM59_3823 [Verrucomicrobiales bacterium]|nr:hypothetical protein [Verrucomicrobiales bacterium]
MLYKLSGGLAEAGPIVRHHAKGCGATGPEPHSGTSFGTFSSRFIDNETGKRFIACFLHKILVSNVKKQKISPENKPC